MSDFLKRTAGSLASQAAGLAARAPGAFAALDSRTRRTIGAGALVLLIIYYPLGMLIYDRVDGSDTKLVTDNAEVGDIPSADAADANNPISRVIIPGGPGIDAPGTTPADGEAVIAEADTAPAAEDSDNPASLGPAGTVHISLRDWMLFAQDQMDGAHGHGKLLKPETYRALHTPISSTGLYALGWGAKLGPDGVPLILTHSGSNGYWLSDIRIWPKHNIIFLMTSNIAGDEAEKAFKEVRDALTAKLHPTD